MRRARTLEVIKEGRLPATSKGQLGTAPLRGLLRTGRGGAHKGGIRSALVWAYRRATARFRDLPAFVIVGASKCGTTTAYRTLTQHPSIAPAWRKEVRYFSVEKNFASGVGWYRAHFPFRRSDRLSGEATPQYLAFPQVPERMARIIPSAKLIALLRHPVDRAYSQYQHAVRDGYERRSFETAIAHQLENAQDATGWVTSYLSRGLYLAPLEQLLRVFPREQLLIVRSEDYYDRSTETLATMLEFLGLPERVLQPSWRPNSHSPMAPATRECLLEYFRPHNRRLFAWLGRDLGWDT